MIEGNVPWTISSCNNEGTFISMFLINLEQLIFFLEKSYENSVYPPTKVSRSMGATKVREFVFRQCGPDSNPVAGIIHPDEFAVSSCFPPIVFLWLLRFASLTNKPTQTPNFIVKLRSSQQPLREHDAG